MGEQTNLFSLSMRKIKESYLNLQWCRDETQTEAMIQSFQIITILDSEEEQRKKHLKYKLNQAINDILSKLFKEVLHNVTHLLFKLIHSSSES